MVKSLAMLIATTSIASAADTGAFNCMDLTPEQTAWFQRGAPSRCCKLADGRPTLYEHRGDGIYVPPFGAQQPCEDPLNVSAERRQWLEDKSFWVQVPPSTILKSSNPIGWAVIWFVNDGTLMPAIRCIALLSEG